jgi:hypothetical protein
MSPNSPTRFGSLLDYQKGRVEPISDDVKNYAFSNCFEIANASKPYEKVVFGQNQVYVLEVIRAEGTSPWFICAHDEFALCMDGVVRIDLVKPATGFQTLEEKKNGAVLFPAQALGARMGWMKLRRGHQAMLPANSPYQFMSDKPAVLILQTCKGDLSIERWSTICQTK